MGYDKAYDIMDAYKSKVLATVDGKPGDAKGQMVIEDVFKEMAKVE
jgi:hypothetical protein